MPQPWLSLVDASLASDDPITVVYGNVFDLGLSEELKTEPQLDLLAAHALDQGYFPVYYDSVFGFRIPQPVQEADAAGRLDAKLTFVHLFGLEIVPPEGDALDLYNEKRLAEDATLSAVPPQDSPDFADWWGHHLKWKEMQIAGRCPNKALEAQLNRYACHDIFPHQYDEWAASLPKEFVPGQPTTPAAYPLVLKILEQGDENEADPRPLLIFRDAYKTARLDSNSTESASKATYILTDVAVHRRPRRSRLVLVSPSMQMLDATIRSLGSVGLVEVPMPTADDLTGMLTACHPEMDPERSVSMGRALAGLSFFQALKVHTDSSYEDAVAQKIQLANREYAGLLEIVQPTHGFEALFLDVKLLNHVRMLSQAMLLGDERLGAAGVVFAGPPGTAKTRLAMALAKELQLGLVVKIDTGKWRAGLVGATEENTERALRGLRAFAPAVVINDEADQSEAPRGSWDGDNGTSGRIRKAMLEFWSDPWVRSQLLLIQITNRIDLIDTAMLRSGRSDSRIPMLMPTPEEAAQILVVQAINHHVQLEDSVDPDALLDRLYTRLGQKDSAGKVVYPTVSGADVEKIVLDAFKVAWAEQPVGTGGLRSQPDVVLNRHLVTAVNRFRLSTSPKVTRMQEIVAVLHASDEDLLPVRYQGKDPEDLRDTFRSLKKELPWS